MSWNGINRSGLVSFTVNLMLGSTELMCLRYSLLMDVFNTTKILSTSYPQTWEVESCAECFGLKTLHEKIGHNRAYGQPHSSSFQLLIIFALGINI